MQDVAKDPRYLSGSSLVKSEIVVPIFINRKLTAELDVESYFADTFTKQEQEFVEACAKVVADYWSQVNRGSGRGVRLARRVSNKTGCDGHALCDAGHKFSLCESLFGGSPSDKLTIGRGLLPK